MGYQLLDCFYATYDKETVKQILACDEKNYGKDYSEAKMHIEKYSFSLCINFDLLSHFFIEPICDFPDYVRFIIGNEQRILVKKSDLPLNLQL